MIYRKNKNSLATNLRFEVPKAGPSLVMSGETTVGWGDDNTIWGPAAPTAWVDANRRGLIVNGTNGIVFPGAGGAIKWASNINVNAAPTLALCQAASGVAEFGDTT